MFSLLQLLGVLPLAIRSIANRPELVSGQLQDWIPKTTGDKLLMEKKIVELLAELFELPPDQISDDLSMDSCEIWDSFKHMEMITILEREFTVEFTFEELSEILGVKAIRETLARKLV